MSDIQSTHSVLVTGATGGIGAATVRVLAGRGYAVYAAARGDAAELAGIGGVQVVPMDVTDPDTVEAAAKQVERDTAGRGLRAVVNNAGIIIQGPLELVPPEDLRRPFAVNTIGPVYVTQAFLPLLRAGTGRVVNISAPPARVPVPFIAPGAASKAALNALSDALRMELAAWGIPVSVVEPGATSTGIFAKAETAARAALRSAEPDRLRLYARHLAAVEKAMASQRPSPPENVASVIVRAIEARRPRRRYLAGGDARIFGLLSHLPAGLRDALVTRTLGLAGIRISE